MSAFWLALLRRWYFLLAALLLTAGATYYVVDRIGPAYEATGTSLLFPPSTTIDEGTNIETQGNPYLMLSGLTQARDLVIRRMTSKDASEELAERYPNVEYEVTQDYMTSAPVVLVTVESPEKAQTVAALDELLASVPVILEDLQVDLDLEPHARITARQLTADSTPKVVRKAQIRGGIVAGVLTLGVSLLLLGLYDGLRGMRPRRGAGAAGSGGKRVKAEPAGGEGAGAPPVTTLRRAEGGDAGEVVARSRRRERVSASRR